jgi:hypothetical protein
MVLADCGVKFASLERYEVVKESAQLDWWEMNNTKDARYQRGE